MGSSLFEKIIESHRPKGTNPQAESLSLTVDQVLTQDATGTMVYLQFEAIGVDRIKIPLAVSYVDHNTLQGDAKNPDDHRFLQTAAARYGAWFSPPGNGISHQLHLEHFARPGQVLLGSDSHTPTCGGMAMLAMGCGGLDIAAAMAGFPYTLPRPRVRRIWVTGKLRRPWVTAMDVGLEMLRRLTVRGGLGWVMEYDGPGIKDLSLTERATICNMGAELGATTSLFPSDSATLSFLKAQGRPGDWGKLQADPDARYEEEIELDLGTIEPLAAQPFSPDQVVPLKKLKGLKVDQVCIGSCTNSSHAMLKIVAKLLKGKTVASTTSLLLNPGSRQVLRELARKKDLEHLISSGARLLEAACGPCIGMGGAPPDGGISFRTYNRNFKGRSGTPNARVYLCSPVSAALIALKGEVVDPFRFPIKAPRRIQPSVAEHPDPLIQPPSRNPEKIPIIRGPNIKPIPKRKPLADSFKARVLIKLGDHISTDDILPGGARILPLRSNIPAIARYAFSRIDPAFPERAEKAGMGLIVGGENYAQGSSREHAAIVPMYLGVQAVLAKSFARIHLSNLINYGILPLVFKDPLEYEKVSLGDELEFSGVRQSLRKGTQIKAYNHSKKEALVFKALVPKEKIPILLAGGLLPYLKKMKAQSQIPPSSPL